MPEANAPDVTRTAVVGLGQMGRGIARNLDKIGLLVAAFDIGADAFSSAGLSKSVLQCEAAALGECADVILFAVPSTTEIAGFFDGAWGRAGQLVIDVTTSDPAESRELAARLAERGIRYIDAAMTGGAAGADAGTLTLMLGGEAEDVKHSTPVLDAVSARKFHLGPVGSGHAMKLVHNLILHSSFLATCEGLRLAERAGIDLGQAIDVLNAGNARSFVTEVRFPRDILSGTMDARSRIANLEKDLGLALRFGLEQDGLTPFSDLTHSILAEAITAGHANSDFSNLFPLFEQLVAGREVKE